MVILVTGASSGIGYSAALSLARRGHTVYGAARRLERMSPLAEEGVIPVRLDVTDSQACRELVERIALEQGRIDALVNNAGYGYFGAIETVSDEQARRQIEVNLFALASLTRLVLPLMRTQGRGRIVNISSVAGKVVLPFGGWYHVSKFAVEAFSDALRMEVRPFGISVSLIEPGGIKTDWGGIAADNLESSTRGTVYEKAAAKEAALLRYGYSGNFLSRPGYIARSVVRAVESRRPRLRYRSGRGASLLVFFHSILPARWWDALMRLFI